jgi:hypothetical protein
MNVTVDIRFLHGVDALINLLNADGVDGMAKELCDVLETMLDTKYTAMQRRQQFTEYKQSQAGSNERELMRQQYLDSAGIAKTFRTTSEQNI